MPREDVPWGQWSSSLDCRTAPCGICWSCAWDSCHKPCSCSVGCIAVRVVCRKATSYQSQLFFFKMSIELGARLRLGYGMGNNGTGGPLTSQRFLCGPKCFPLGHGSNSIASVICSLSLQCMYACWGRRCLPHVRLEPDHPSEGLELRNVGVSILYSRSSSRQQGCFRKQSGFQNKSHASSEDEEGRAIIRNKALTSTARLVQTQLTYSSSSHLALSLICMFFACTYAYACAYASV